MINHMYLLLVNRRRADTEEAAPWDRYIPDDFTPTALPAYLERIRKALIGPHTHWWDVTYRAEALLQVLTDAWRKDTRPWMDEREIPPVTMPADYHEPAVTITKTASATGSTGTLVQLSSAGRSSAKPPVLEKWLVKVSGGVVTVRDEYTGLVRTFDYSVGAKIPLSVHLSAALGGAPLSGDTWTVRSFTRLRSTVADTMAAVRALPYSDIEQLFAVNSLDDPATASALIWYDATYKRSMYSQDALDAVASAYFYKALGLDDTV